MPRPSSRAASIYTRRIYEARKYAADRPWLPYVRECCTGGSHYDSRMGIKARCAVVVYLWQAEH